MHYLTVLLFTFMFVYLVSYAVFAVVFTVKDWWWRRWGYWRRR